MALILGWLGADSKHLMKVAQLYLDQDYDALLVRISPFQLMFPTLGGQMIADELLTFLHHNENYAPIVIHGFSAGAYVWSETVVKILRAKSKYEWILNRIRAQTWDSVADITEMPNGISKTLFPNNKVLEATIRHFLRAYLRLFYHVTTVHYDECQKVFYKNVVRAPALYFVGKDDLIGTERLALICKKEWSALGIPVTLKSWNESSHIKHIVLHRDEYIKMLKDHLQSLDLLPYPEKLISKL